MWLGFRHDLKQTDLYVHPGEGSSEKLLKNFNQYVVSMIKFNDSIPFRLFLFLCTDTVTGRQS